MVTFPVVIGLPPSLARSSVHPQRFWRLDECDDEIKGDIAAVLAATNVPRLASHD
jgi:hypothetical protein